MLLEKLRSTAIIGIDKENKSNSQNILFEKGRQKVIEYL